MSTRYYYKNNYIISKRNYLDDYSHVRSKKIDMTMSGKYLGKYPNLDINYNELDEYPKSNNIKKLENIIKTKNNTENEVIIGCGSNGILQNLVKIYVKKGENILTPYYTFNQVEYAATSLGAITKRIFMDEEEINFERIINSIDKKTKLIYICNPNNPTGIYISSKNIIEFSKQVEKQNKNIKIIIDESAIEFTNKKSILEYKIPQNMIVVRTLSKAYGIPNLRVGYMICHKEDEIKYKKNVTNNETSSIVCNMAFKVIKSDLYKENVKLIIKERKFLERELKKIGIETYKSDSNILMTKNIFTLEQLLELEKNEISIVRVIDSNKNAHIRIATQDRKTNQEFINKLKEVIKDEDIFSNKF